MNGLSHKYLSPADLRRLRHLFFSSRRPVEGLYAGRHASMQRGHSVEFNDYRVYTPGDEVGDIDWKVFGRTDRLFIKLFEHQSDMAVHLVVDGSASMAFSGAEDPRAPRPRGRQSTKLPVSKYDHACRIAAAIAFLTLRQQDKVSFAVAREGTDTFHPPRGALTHLPGILKSMESTKIGGRAQLAETIRRVATRVGRKGLLVVISDLFEDPAPILDALSLFAHRGGDALVFHVMHEQEMKLPDMDEAIFIDSESLEKLPLNVADIRRGYDDRVRHFLDTWRTAFRGRGVDYELVTTDRDYADALQHYLFTRASTA
ncbi:MAG: DUF58 domain-containing protein [Phycisphaera sp.]|nr:DUF58 domain-containing protein [Phycisphaera sp.]